MKPHRLNKPVDFLDPFKAETASAERRARRRLKSFLDKPNMEKLYRYEVAAEHHQLAVGREAAARKLKESWQR